MPEYDPIKERAVFEEETKRLSAGNSRLIKMTHEGEEFSFDSTDLAEHVAEFTNMRAQGWQVDAKSIPLPAFHPARHQVIKQEGFESSDWGYKKTNPLS